MAPDAKSLQATSYTAQCRDLRSNAQATGSVGYLNNVAPANTETMRSALQDSLTQGLIYAGRRIHGNNDWTILLILGMEVLTKQHVAVKVASIPTTSDKTR